MKIHLKHVAEQDFPRHGSILLNQVIEVVENFGEPEKLKGWLFEGSNVHTNNSSRLSSRRGKIKMEKHGEY